VMLNIGEGVLEAFLKPYLATHGGIPAGEPQLATARRTGRRAHILWISLTACSGSERPAEPSVAQVIYRPAPLRANLKT
jgi:hypothetical protein